MMSCFICFSVFLAGQFYSGVEVSGSLKQHMDRKDAWERGVFKGVVGSQDVFSFPINHLTSSAEFCVFFSQDSA